jgi:membrane-associated protease RseP (regulator of RpoE activity)
MATARLSKLLLAFVFGGGAMAAMAQDGSDMAASRTPANAQKFLAATPPEFFHVGRLSFSREGNVSSPEACVTAMSGNAVTFDGTKFVAPTTKSVSTPQNYGAMDGRKFVTVTNAFLEGLSPGDEIVSINDQEIASQNDLNQALAKLAVSGVKARFKLARKGLTLYIVAKPTLSPQVLNEAPADAISPFHLIVDWSKVQAVEGGGKENLNFVLINTPNDTQAEKKYLYYSVAETRDRVLAAAQYLQSVCDQTKELGF